MLILNLVYNFATVLLSYTGYAMAFRGDLIRCTVMFKDAKKIGNTALVRVPVEFTLNHTKIIPEGQDGEFYVDYNPNEKGIFPYIGMMDKGCSVFTKVMPSLKTFKVSAVFSP